MAILECSRDTSIDAGDVFNRLSQKKDRELRDRMDYWINGGVNDDWFHGWSKPEKHRECFVFRWKQRGINHRIYGFLCHPIDLLPRFIACVLVSHATKAKWHTDQVILDRMCVLQTDPAVSTAVRREFQSLL